MSQDNDNKAAENAGEAKPANQPKATPKPANQPKATPKPANQPKDKFLVAPLAPRIKYNGNEYWPGDEIEADAPGELDRLVAKGYLVSPSEREKKGEYQATDEAVKRQGKQIRQGSKVETPVAEGALDDDGESHEVDKPRSKKGKK